MCGCQWTGAHQLWLWVGQLACLCMIWAQLIKVKRVHEEARPHSCSGLVYDWEWVKVDDWE
jgi:hypothetical protein